MSMEVNNVATKVRVLDNQFRLQRLLTILESPSFDELASSSLTVMLRVENKRDILVN